MESRRCGVIRSPPDLRDWNVRNYLTRSLPPKVLDLRHALFPVRDQGKTPTCAAQTASTMKEWQEKQIGEGKNTSAITGYLSPMFVYNNRENQNEDGMYSRNVMQILTNKGICYENSYPLGASFPVTDKINEEASNFKIGHYASITDIDNLKKSLYENGPCLVALPVYNSTPEFWKQRAGEVLQGGHAVTAVGYSETHIILRNSWGTGWGISGYTYFPFSEFETIWEIWSSIDIPTPVIPLVPPRSCCVLL